jgi:hypothetical protein
MSISAWRGPRADDGYPDRGPMLAKSHALADFEVEIGFG